MKNHKSETSFSAGLTIVLLAARLVDTGLFSVDDGKDPGVLQPV